jgi:MFS family permease
MEGIVMSDKTKKISFVAIITTIALSGLISYFSIDTIMSNPLELTFQLSNATRIAVDNKNQKYIIYNSLKNIAKINSSDRVEYILGSGTGDPERFDSAWDLTVDDSGNLFVVDYVLDDSGLKIDSENIKMFDLKGNFVRKIYSKAYTEDEKPELEGNYRKIKYHEGRIFYYYHDSKKYSIGSINIADGHETVIVSSFEDNPKLNILDCDFTPDLEKIAFLTKRGQIFIGSKNRLKNMNLVYTSSNYRHEKKRSIPWQIVLTPEAVHFSDLGKHTIEKIRLKNDLDRQVSSSEISGVVTSFKIVDNSFAAISEDSLYQGDFSGALETKNEGYNYTTLIAMSRIGVFLAAVALAISLILLVVWIYIVPMKRTISDVLIQSLMIVSVVVIAAIIVINISISTLTGIYKENLFDSLKYINQLSIMNIDGGLIEKLRSREDFMNADYVKLRQQLHRQFNNNNDAWNSDYYGALYVLEDEKVYVLMFYDDSSGLYFPHRNNVKESHFAKVFDTGEYIAVEESDIYGSWIFSIGPVYNSRGKIVAALEVGKDLNSFNAKIRDLIKNVNKEIATILVILVLFMIEIAIIRNVFKNREKQSDSPLGQYSVEIVRMLSFILAFAYALPISYVPLMMKQIMTSSGTGLFGLPEGIAMAVPISSEMLATAVFAIISGNLIEKRGWKPPFMIGAACMIAGSLIGLLCTNPYLFVVSRTFVGACYGFALVAMQCYPMAARDVETRNFGIASYHSGLNAGFCCGVAIGGILADNFGYFKVYGVSVFVALIAAMFAAKFMSNAHTFMEEGAEKIKVTFGEVFRFFRNRNVFLFFATAFVPVSMCGMFMYYQFPVFAETQGLTAGDISRVFMLNCIIIIYLGPLLVNFLSKKAFTRGIFAISVYIIISLLGLVIFGFKPAVITAIVAVALLGLGDSFGLPMSNDYVIGLKAASRIGYDKSIGYLNFIGNMGQMTGPLILGFLFTLGYQSGVTYLAAAIMALMIVFIIFTKKERVQPEIAE